MSNHYSFPPPGPVPCPEYRPAPLPVPADGGLTAPAVAGSPAERSPADPPGPGRRGDRSAAAGARCGILTLAVWRGWSVLLIIVDVANERSLEALTAADFRDHKGTQFRVTGESADDGSPTSFEAELVDVTEYPGNAVGSFRAPFSVVFHGPLEPVMPQGTYRLEHEQFGGVELFMVPIGPNAPGEPGQAPTAMRYEAVFG